MKKWCSERIPPTDPDRKFKLDETFKSMINKAHTSRRGKKYKIFRNHSYKYKYLENYLASYLFPTFVFHLSNSSHFKIN